MTLYHSANLHNTEYQKLVCVNDGRVAYRTIRVRKHKVHMSDRANVTVRVLVCRMMGEYIQHIRPLHGTSSDLPLSKLCGEAIGPPLTKCSAVGVAFGVLLPTATENQHITLQLAST